MLENEDGVLAHVGTNLRRYRAAADLSQAELAQRSGLSRRTIVSLEAGNANVSLSSLDRLTGPLGTTFVDLVRAPTATSDRIGALAWTGRNDDSRAVLLGSAPAQREAQLWSWSLAVGDRYDARPDPPGWHEMIIVSAGYLLIERDEGPVELGPGEYAIYSSAQMYSYLNVADTTTVFVRNVVT